MVVQKDLDEEQAMRIDDLAHITGIPGRTIRFYNTEGLLPPPIIRGRIAYYTHEHQQVLNIIKELKERQNLPLHAIRELLQIRAEHGDVQMILALKQRLLSPLTDTSQTRFSKEELVQRTGISAVSIEEMAQQGLLFPGESEGEQVFTSDDLLLLELYQGLEQLGLPLALPALIRFQLRQLVRSELAAYERHLRPRWQEEGVAPEQQVEQFEKMLALTDTLISILHRKFIYQSS
ncbi:MAG TPA: MerR family transcriptional regulator [Ktedonobacteraceae bacterium]|nr:MerR family transcriptional regulator [Ktedonobacteraceae bacterium]